MLFAGVLSAALAGATRAALLAFILPVMVPGPGLGRSRPGWAGWTLAAMLAVPLAVFLWPPRDHDRLRRRAAGGLRRTGRPVDGLGAPASPTGGRCAASRARSDAAHGRSSRCGPSSAGPTFGRSA